MSSNESLPRNFFRRRECKRNTKQTLFSRIERLSNLPRKHRFFLHDNILSQMKTLTVKPLKGQNHHFHDSLCNVYIIDLLYHDLFIITYDNKR